MTIEASSFNAAKPWPFNVDASTGSPPVRRPFTFLTAFAFGLFGAFAPGADASGRLALDGAQDLVLDPENAIHPFGEAMVMGRNDRGEALPAYEFQQFVKDDI